MLQSLQTGLLAQLGNKELEKAAVTVAEGVREYSTGKRGR